VFDAKRFADMNVDTDAWEIEPEDLERLRQHTGDVVQARSGRCRWTGRPGVCRAFAVYIEP
jgi:hypothetical protein